MPLILLESSFWSLLLTSCADQLSFLMPCFGNSGTLVSPAPELCLWLREAVGFLLPSLPFCPSSRSPSPVLPTLLPPSPFPKPPASRSAGAGVGLASFVPCLSEITALCHLRICVFKTVVPYFWFFFFFFRLGVNSVPVIPSYLEVCPDFYNFLCFNSYFLFCIFVLTFFILLNSLFVHLYFQN